MLMLLTRGQMALKPNNETKEFFLKVTVGWWELWSGCLVCASKIKNVLQLWLAVDGPVTALQLIMFLFSQIVSEHVF